MNDERRQHWMDEELAPCGFKQFRKAITRVQVEDLRPLAAKVMANENLRNVAYKTGKATPSYRTQQRWNTNRSKAAMRIAMAATTGGTGGEK